MSELSKGCVFGLKGFTALHRGNEGQPSRVISETYKMKKGYRAVVVLLGIEPDDGSASVDHVKAFYDLGYVLDPAIANDEQSPLRWKYNHSLFTECCYKFNQEYPDQIQPPLTIKMERAIYDPPAVEPGFQHDFGVGDVPSRRGTFTKKDGEA